MVHNKPSLSHFSPDSQLDDVANGSRRHTSWWGDEDPAAAFPANYFDPTSMFADVGTGGIVGIGNTTAADGAQLTGARSNNSSSSNSDPGTSRGGSTPQEEATGSQQGSGRRGRKPLTADQIKRRREQNRRSQKNFRQKKDGRIAQLETELRETTRQNELLEQHIYTLQSQMPGGAVQTHTPGSWTSHHGDLGGFQGGEGQMMMSEMSSPLEEMWFHGGGVTVFEADAVEWEQSEGGGADEYGSAMGLSMGATGFDVTTSFELDTFDAHGNPGRHASL